MPVSPALIRRSALAAAGSVVLAAGLLACDPDEKDTADTASAVTDTDTSADTDTPDCTGGDDTADTGPGDCLGIKDPETWAACCETLALWCNEQHPKDDTAALACLYGEDLSGEETGCIPWGPPVPPAATVLA